VLTIRKESLEDLPSRLDIEPLTRLETIFLQPSLYIQSDHEKFRALTAQILASEGAQDARIAASRLVDWVYRNIEKRPVISVPDALATLENRQGDCNEHAVLLAALARAAGIPARIETGLVYLEGRFYYHAWNLLYLGRWVTADASFGQLPADVTHIRLASGHQNQFELLGAFNRLRVEVIGPLNGHGLEADPPG
jgi:transglutaminase-like putative cysteine protease